MKKYNPPKECRLSTVKTSSRTLIKLISYNANGIVFYDKAFSEGKLFIPYQNILLIEEIECT